MEDDFDLDNNDDVEDVEDVENMQRHEGCIFTEFTAGKTTSYTTDKGDRYTVSKRSTDGLILYLRCAICKKGRRLERDSVDVLWKNAKMAQMVALHGQNCNADVRRNNLYVNKKKVRAQASIGKTFGQAQAIVLNESLASNNGDMNAAAAEMPLANKSNSSQFSRSSSSRYPKLPSAEDVEIVIPEQYRRKSALPGVADGLFLQSQDVVQGQPLLIFSSDFMIEKFAEGTCISFDGTFKAPDPFVQLFIVFFVEPRRNIMYPVFYALLCSKTQVAYTHVFRVILDLLRLKQDNNPDLLVKMSQSMSDFELGMRNGLDSVLAEASYFRDFQRNIQIQVTHHGCLFHHMQAMYRKLKELGLSKFLSRNTELHVNLPSFIKKLGALSFLPVTEVNETFQNLVIDQLPPFAQNSLHQQLFEQFLVYYKRTWLGYPFANDMIVNEIANLTTVARHNIYGLDRRTNNDAEGHNSAMSKDLFSTKSHLWKYIEYLQSTNLAQELKITQTMNPAWIAPPRAPYLIKRDTEIERLSSDRSNNAITNKEFVIAVSLVLSSPKSND